MVQGESGLDQARDPGRGVEMADVGLQRADGAVVPAAVLALAEDPRQGGDLDRIAERRGGAVALDVGERAGIDAGVLVGLPVDVHLAFDGGCHEAHLERAVVVAGRALDHGVDGVALGESVVEALEYHDAGAVAGDEAGGGGRRRRGSGRPSPSCPPPGRDSPRPPAGGSKRRPRAPCRSRAGAAPGRLGAPPRARSTRRSGW